ncbi:MAG: hypothetical protein ACKOYM_09095, partial [Actinomycetes bacterium]
DAGLAVAVARRIGAALVGGGAAWATVAVIGDVRSAIGQLLVVTGAGVLGVATFATVTSLLGGANVGPTLRTLGSAERGAA